MDELVPILIALVALTVAWLVVKPPAAFVVTVRDGETHVTQGKVTDAFLSVIIDVCQEFDLRAAEVRGVARGNRIALRFSSGFSPAAQQRLRNWWAQSGWSAKPGR